MGSIIVIQFASVDGIVEDPDGSAGTPSGGWAFRFGPEAIAGDKFRLGALLDTGVLLFGRQTWQLFSRLWPNRSGDFADAMNRIDKTVASRRPLDVGAWANSKQLDGELIHGVTELASQRDVVVIGSTSIVHALADADLVDEYRLLVFPVALGGGQRLFTRRVDLELADVHRVGPLTLTYYRRGEMSRLS